LDNNNCTALHYAANNGHCGVIEELLDINADINAKDTTGCPPLH